MIVEMLLMFLILLDFIKLELYYYIPILLCMLLIMPVKLKDFIHAIRSNRNNIKKISWKVTKFFMEPPFIINELIIKNKLFTKLWSTYTRISLLPLSDPNNSSVNNSPQGNERLFSFFPGWPQSVLLPPLLLASAGYYYTGVKDFIKCGGCGTIRQPSIEGIKEFKKNLKCETCHYNCTFIRGSQITYDSEYDRLLSFFSGSSQFSLLPPLTLANAGYYYTGFNNTIACSHCGAKRQLRIDEIDEFKKDLRCRKCIEDKHAEDLSPHTLVRNLLQKENQMLKHMLTCKICTKSPIQDVFLPCGEMYACKACSNKLTHCPSCGKIILATVTTYFP